MATVAKVLIGLSALAFLLAVFVSLFGPMIYDIPAESFSRASNNLVLLAIGLVVCMRGASAGDRT
jgi:hypothetical protein